MQDRCPAVCYPSNTWQDNGQWKPKKEAQRGPLGDSKTRQPARGHPSLHLLVPRENLQQEGAPKRGNQESSYTNNFKAAALFRLSLFLLHLKLRGFASQCKVKSSKVRRGKLQTLAECVWLFLGPGPRAARRGRHTGDAARGPQCPGCVSFA
ncbi:hypothetical protein H920_13446 [Fukomys damarensis]|uniref:Uncharacterized protein n=1 Tax=Fukomys damarensis TaxID=885580 RepID=A0A091CZC4_FUKDA|nr:hypothetical protein H920_13446 [Fukomys damarensis]